MLTFPSGRVADQVRHHAFAYSERRSAVPAYVPQAVIGLPTFADQRYYGYKPKSCSPFRAAARLARLGIMPLLTANVSKPSRLTWAVIGLKEQGETPGLLSLLRVITDISPTFANCSGWRQLCGSGCSLARALFRAAAIPNLGCGERVHKPTAR